MEESYKQAGKNASSMQFLDDSYITLYYSFPSLSFFCLILQVNQ